MAGGVYGAPAFKKPLPNLRTRHSEESQGFKPGTRGKFGPHGIYGGLLRKNVKPWWGTVKPSCKSKEQEGRKTHHLTAGGGARFLSR